MKVKCPGCRAVPRMVRITKGEDGVHLHYVCVYRECRFCGKEVAERVVAGDGESKEL